MGGRGGGVVGGGVRVVQPPYVFCFSFVGEGGRPALRFSLVNARLDTIF